MRSPHGTEQGRLAARQGEELGEVLVARPSLLLADTVELRNKLRYLTRYRVDPVRCESAPAHSDPWVPLIIGDRQVAARRIGKALSGPGTQTICASELQH